MISWPKRRPKPQPGDQVQFTRMFLSATGQSPTGPWTVIACGCELCGQGKHVAVNEPAPTDPFGNEMIAWGTPWRHIHASNLSVVECEAAPLTPRVSRDDR